jgi:hypothetical protein
VVIGRFEATGRLKVAAAGLDAAVSDLAASWTATLDW